jgi:hypothetical protein
LLAIRFIAKEEVALLHFFAQVAEARSALDPAFVTQFVGASRPLAEIVVEFPPTLGVDFENPDPWLA